MLILRRHHLKLLICGLVYLMTIAFIVLSSRYLFSLYFPSRFGPRDYTPMEFTISTTWDGQQVSHTPVKVSLTATDFGNDMNIDVEAPFFNDPPNPGGDVGKPFNQLWDYEVVEAFFLNDNNDYLEIELCPHGQHLLLILRGERHMVKDMLPLKYTAVIDKGYWHGTARIPGSYFPRAVSKFNAYAIHGSDPNRVYESLYPVPKGQFSSPDFHRLSYFKPIDLQQVIPTNYNEYYHSDLWDNVPANTKS